jgi:hypothetical protein
VLSTIDYEAQTEAHGKLWAAKADFDRTKGWFGSCSGPCVRAKAKFEAAQTTYGALQAQEAATVSVAKREVGLMSEYGVQETRDLFWGTFAGGKAFGKRQSMWDLLFTGLRWGKDEEAFSVLVRWVFQLVLNFTIGLVGALVVFVYKLWGLIGTYAPDPVTALVYFGLASLAATACVASYLLALYGAAAGSVAVVAKAIVDHNHRIANDPNYARRQNLQGQQGPGQRYRPPGATYGSGASGGGGGYSQQQQQQHQQPRQAQPQQRPAASSMDHID